MEQMKKFIITILIFLASLILFSANTNNTVPNDLFFEYMNGKIKECISIGIDVENNMTNVVSHEYFNEDGYLKYKCEYFSSGPFYLEEYYYYEKEKDKFIRYSTDESWIMSLLEFASDGQQKVDAINEMETIEEYFYDNMNRIYMINKKDKVHINNAFNETETSIYYDEKGRVASINTKQNDYCSSLGTKNSLKSYKYDERDNIISFETNRNGWVELGGLEFDQEGLKKYIKESNGSYKRYSKKYKLCKYKADSESKYDSIYIEYDGHNNGILISCFKNGKLSYKTENIIIYYE